MLLRFLTVAFTIAALLPAMLSTAANDVLAHWFNAGRCSSFNGPYAHTPPYVKHDPEYLIWMPYMHGTRMSRATPSYLYDPKTRVAFRSIGQDSSGSRTLRTIDPPPKHLAEADLGALHTTSGARLGTSATTIRQMLGEPYVIRGCGLERYAYSIDREVGGNALEFTVKNGRVVEIFQSFGD